MCVVSYKWNTRLVSQIGLNKGDCHYPPRCAVIAVSTVLRCIIYIATSLLMASYFLTLNLPHDHPDKPYLGDPNPYFCLDTFGRLLSSGDLIEPKSLTKWPRFWEKSLRFEFTVLYAQTSHSHLSSESTKSPKVPKSQISLPSAFLAAWEWLIDVHIHNSYWILFISLVPKHFEEFFSRSQLINPTWLPW